MLENYISHTGVQTEELKIFNGRGDQISLRNLIGNSVDLKKLKISKEITVDIEDHIVHQLLNPRVIMSKNTVLNTWVKSPFNRRTVFTIINNTLICNIKSYYHSIVERCSHDTSLTCYVEQIKGGLTDVIMNRRMYLTKFNKVKYMGSLSLALGFSLFIIWLSECLTDKIAGFVFDFIMLFYITINKRCVVEEINQYFKENYLESERFPDIGDTEALYKFWLDGNAVFYLEPVELIGFLCDYFKGVNFHKFCSA